MKPFLFLVATVAFVQSQAQPNSTYQNDLSRLKEVIEQLPSFKAQITGEKREAFNNEYTRLFQQRPESKLAYFKNLSALLFPLKDYHLALYEKTDFNHFKNNDSLTSYLNSQEFADYPRVDINIDSLKTILAARPADSVEGIYFYDKYYTVGLYQETTNEYLGVILESKTPLWLPGQLAVYLVRAADNSLKAIYGHPRTKSLILVGNEKYRNQSLVNSFFYGSLSNTVYRKNRDSSDVVNLPFNSNRFELKQVDEQTQYLLVRTFQRDSKTLALSAAFLQKIQDSLNSPYLILDLRNNEGGAKSEMQQYYSLLKKYKGSIYILINNGTLSQAEIFTLELKKLSNTVTLGQTTKGMLTYGSNYGHTITLPGGKYNIYPTDMKGTKEHLQYEGTGITPDIALNEKEPWISQTRAFIHLHSANNLPVK